MRSAPSIEINLQNEVQQAYISYFGRAADVAGLAFYTSLLSGVTTPNQSLFDAARYLAAKSDVRYFDVVMHQVLGHMGQSGEASLDLGATGIDEALFYFDSSPSDAYADTTHQTALLDAYVAGQITKEQYLWDLSVSPVVDLTSGDVAANAAANTVFTSKITFSNLFTNMVRTLNLDYSGTTDYGNVNTALAAITTNAEAINYDTLIRTVCAVVTGDERISGLEMTAAQYGVISTADASRDVAVRTQTLLNADLVDFGLTIVGTDGADTMLVYTFEGSFTHGIAINGGAGADVITGGTGADSILGGNDNDSIVGGVGNDTINGGAGDDTINGGAGNDSLLGDAGADSIESGDGSDYINAGDDNDTIIMAAYLTTADTIAGGAGTDTLTFTDSNSAATDLDHVTEVEVITLGDATTVVTTVNTLVAAGASLTVNASALTGTNTLTWNGAAELDGVFNVTGGAAADSITGGAGADSILGGAGTDSLVGGAGNDTINGGADNDTINGGAGNDSLLGDAGNDTFMFTSASELNGDSTVNGDDGTDIILFTAATTIEDSDFDHVSYVEKIQLADGTNSVTLGAYTYYAGVHTILGGSGSDTITTSSVDSERSAITIDLTSGGTDTVAISNASLNGFDSDDTDVDNIFTIANSNTGWTTTDGVSAVTILGFTPNNGGDRVSSTFDTGFADNVNPSTTSLLSFLSGSVFEIASSAYQVNNFTNLYGVAGMLDTLNNVNDGTYYIIVYDGTSASSNAGLYIATATEGDGFDFADANGATGGVDTDTLELVAIFSNVGADTFTSQNFI